MIAVAARSNCRDSCRLGQVDVGCEMTVDDPLPHGVLTLFCSTVPDTCKLFDSKKLYSTKEHEESSINKDAQDFL